MKTKYLYLLLVMVVLLSPLTTTTAHAQDPLPPTAPTCNFLDLICWAKLTLSGGSTTSSVIQPTPTVSMFHAPTPIPAIMATFADRLDSYMMSTGKTTIYAYHVDGEGDLNFRTDDSQIPASQQMAPDGSGKSLTNYLCYEPSTKVLPEWECKLDSVYGTWTLGIAGWYADTLTHVSLNLASIYPPGYVIGNTMFYASIRNTGQNCKSIYTSYGKPLYLCAAASSYPAIPTIVVPASTPTPLVTATQHVNSLCNNKVYCAWDATNNIVSIKGDGWSQDIYDFIFGGPAMYPYTFNRVTVSTTWPTEGTFSYCKNVVMSNLPEFKNTLGIATQEYTVCLYK